MNKIYKSTITVQAKVNCAIKETWNMWTDPMHIIRWNAASEDWITSYAENDLRQEGKFLSRMEEKDGPVGFDFVGTYTYVEDEAKIEYIIADGRNVKVTFEENQGSTIVTEEFEPETIHSHELQRSGWQSILDNFKKYAEDKEKNEMLRFSISIQALPQTVYEKVIGKKSYQEWTKAFSSGSHFEGSWDKRAQIRFIGIDSAGNKGGIISRIRENIPSKFISIEHLGVIHGDKEIMSGPEVSGWAGALENYKIISDGNKTIFEVCMDSTKEFKKYFSDTWPKALNLLKELCEIH